MLNPGDMVSYSPKIRGPRDDFVSPNTSSNDVWYLAIFLGNITDIYDRRQWFLMYDPLQGKTYSISHDSQMAAHMKVVARVNEAVG